MQRDPRLRGLSSEHHQALVLARRAGAATSWSEEDAAELSALFETEIDPHFRIEEEVLLPALAEVGELDLVERTRAEHHALRELFRIAGTGDRDAANELGRLLQAHVRFEERTLFPECERLISARALDEVARRCPKS